MIIRNEKGQFIKGVQAYPEASNFKLGMVPYNKGKKSDNISGVNHWNWKGGKPSCVDCGKKLSRRDYTRCHKCERIRKNKIMIGPLSPVWKGGVTSLYESIRKLDIYDQWRFSVYKKDGHICQECGCRDRNILQSHHIKSFSIILKEFLNEYNQFSPIEDKEVLIRLSFTYKPFWEVSNGKTLCIDCHEKTESYSRHIK